MIKVIQLAIIGIDAVSHFFFKIAKILTFLVVLLTAEQVIARYFFGASSIAFQELEWHFFGFMILLGMAYTLALDAHVRVDIIFQKLSKRSQAILDALCIIVFLLPVCLLVVYYGYHFTIAAFDFKNPFPLDNWSKYFLDTSSSKYKLFSDIEAQFKSTILAGEVSPDPGGLQARWIIKSIIPFGFLLLFIQGIAEFFKRLLIILEPKAN